MAVAGAKRLLVVVDDDPHVLRAMERATRRLLASTEVSLLGSGREAVDLVAVRRPALVVVDVNMPDLDGIETTRRLHAHAPHLRIVVVSGNLTDQVANDAREAGAHSWLEKPFDVSALLGPTPEGARAALIEAHVDLAANIARAMARRFGRLLPDDDALALGRLGLCEAAARYDVTRAEPFIAFAERRIRGAILDELRRTSPRSRRSHAVLRRIDAAAATLRTDDGAPDDSAIASYLGLTLAQITAARTPSRVMTSFANDDADTAESPDVPPDAQLERAQLWALVSKVRAQLAPDEVQVLDMLYERGLTATAAAAELGITLAKVIQRHKRAIASVRGALGITAPPP